MTETSPPPSPTLLDRLKQRALDVIDLAERLCTTLPRGSSLEEDCFHTGARVLRCVSLLDERPCAPWALDDLIGRTARLLTIFVGARERGFLDDAHALEALTLCEDLVTLARGLRGDDEGARCPLATSRRPPCLLG